MALIKIKSAAKVREEEQLLAQAQQVCAKKPRTTDRTDYDKAREGFRNCCLTIRKYINETYPELCAQYEVLKTFRGAFDEVAILMEFLTDRDDNYLTKMLLKCSQIDMAMEYEASALAIEQPRTWYSCWEDELGPYDASGRPTSDTSRSETAE